MRILTTFTFLLFCIATYGQNLQLRGEILDSKAQALSSAVVVLLNPSDSTMLYFAIAGNNGRFEMQNIKKGSYLLQASLLGYTTIYHKIDLPSSIGDDIGSLIMAQRVFNIDEVEVMGDRIPMRIKKDTIEYNAKAFKVKADGVAEDIIKKLPGMEVDRAGNIKAMGEDVKNVLVDGKEFFGNDPKVATKNLPADAISKIQLFDKQSDESEFTGIDDAERNPTLNFVLEEGKKSGVFGDVEAGAGSDNHIATGAKIYRFTKQTQFAALGMFNNINQFGFSLGDYINFSGGKSALSGSGGKVILGGENSFPLNFGQPIYGSGSNGAAGLNFSISKSKNNRLFISYLGNGSDRNLFETSSTHNFIPDKSYRVEEWKNEEKRDSAHRLNFGLRKLIGERQNIIINGGIAYNSSSNPFSSFSESFVNDVLVNNLGRNSGDFSSRLSGNADLTYLLKINEGKTILKLSGKTSYSGSNSDTRFLNRTELINPYQLIITNQLFGLDSETSNFSGTASFTQKTTKRSFTSLYITAGLSSDDLTRVQQEVAGTVFRIDSLSPDFSKTEKYFRPGLSWKLSSPKSQISFSILSSIGNYATTLNSDVSVTRNYFYMNPSASWEYDYRSGRRVMFNYSSSVNTPSASQLIPVVNNMNSLSLFYGNRDLRPEYIHNARVSWWLFDQFSFTTLLANLSAQYTHDKINFVRTVDDQLRQIVSLRNFRDDWTAGADVDFSTPIKPLGLKINIALSENYIQGLSLINETENVNNNISHRISLTIDNRKKEKWDIETGSTLTITDSKYSVQNSLNNRYQDISLFTEIRYTPGVHFNIMASADITNYSAKTFDEAQLIPLIGAEASYYFMKNQRGVLTMSLVDLLNRNSGIERMSQLNYLVERRSDIIGRYIMLSFKYRLNKVGDNKGGIDIQIKKR